MGGRGESRELGQRLPEGYESSVQSCGLAFKTFTESENLLHKSYTAPNGLIIFRKISMI
jgi:hypothetical protein